MSCKCTESAFSGRASAYNTELVPLKALMRKVTGLMVVNTVRVRI